MDDEKKVEAGITQKKRGRPKGSKLKHSGLVKENLLQVFENLGGCPGFTRFIKKNPQHQIEFYKIWAKMLPAETNNKNTTELTLGDLVTQSFKLAVPAPETPKSVDLQSLEVNLGTVSNHEGAIKPDNIH